MQNYSTKRGDDFTISLTFKDADGVAIDITGYLILMNIKSEKYLADEDAELQVDGVIDTAEEGLAHITIPATDSANLLGTYYYDIKYVDDGAVKTFSNGVITFEENITIRNEELTP